MSTTAPSKNTSSALAITIGCTTALLVSTAHADPEWTFHGVVASGSQHDARRGPDGRVHVVASEYVQLDATGSVVVQEPAGDGQQGALDFPPALAVGTDGTVHIVTRHGGNWTDGHDIRYRRRNDAGQWDRDYFVGSPVGRNYVVGVAWSAADQVHVFHSEVGADVWGDLHLYRADANSAPYLGAITGVWRADADARARGLAGKVVLASGRPDPNGTTYFMLADVGGGLPEALQASQQTHQSGSGRRGFPDLFVDSAGNVHLTYGAQHTVHYNRYDAPGSQPAFGGDVLIADSLGDWHLSTGLSTVAASDDGETVVAIVLRSDGSQTAADADVLWTYSSDGGQTWTAPADTGRNTHAGEGRRRPHLVAIGQKFFLSFAENGTSGISLATLLVQPDEDGDGFTADVDCDDGNPDVHPGAEEQCNGEDDNCDGTEDEGCACTPGTEQPCGTDEGECQAGVQSCVDGSWGACQGAVGPTSEICDGLDNNCDGTADEGCSGSGGGAQTPGPASAADGDDDSSCGCRVGAGASPGRSAPTGLWATALLGAWAVGSRRRTR